MANLDRAAANARYEETHAALHANQEAEKAAGIDYETPEYLRLNHEANEAAQDPNLPWWRRNR